MDTQVIRAKLLLALARKRKWGESHTAYENMTRQFKSESLGKHGFKLVEEVARGLVREGLVLEKRTHYGLQVSLNPRNAREIKALIKQKLGFEL